MKNLRRISKSKIEKFFLITLVIFSSVVRGQTHTLEPGWNLTGNDKGADVDTITVFGNPVTPLSISPSVVTVWSWDSINKKWNFYAPSMTPTELTTYTNNKGYGVLTKITKGDGFWINASSAVTIDLSITAPIVVSPDAKKIGTGYVARNGMTVTLLSLTTTDLGNGYTRYTTTYKQENTTAVSLNEATLKLYFSNSAAMSQYGSFGTVLPGAAFAVLRSYQFDALSTAVPSVLEYDADNFFAATPVTGSLQWIWPIN